MVIKSWINVTLNISPFGHPQIHSRGLSISLELNFHNGEWLENLVAPFWWTGTCCHPSFMYLPQKIGCELSPAHINYKFGLYAEHCCQFAENIDYQNILYTRHTVNGEHWGLEINYIQTCLNVMP